MRLKFVEGWDPIANAQDVRIPGGRYAGLLVRMTGDAVAANTVALSDFGTVLVKHRGRNIVNATCAALYKHTDMVSGFAVWTPNTLPALAYEFGFVVPFRYGRFLRDKDDNLLNCEEGQLYFQLVGVDHTHVDTCDLELSVIPDLGVARYIVQIGTQAPVLTANARVDLSLPNLRRLLIDQDGFTGLPDSVFMLRGGNELIFEGPWGVLECMSDIEWQREAAAINAAMIDLGRDDFASFTGGKYELRLVGATGEPEITEFGAVPVSNEEYAATRDAGIQQLAGQYASSLQPPTADVAPINPETAGGGTIYFNAPKTEDQATPIPGPSVVPPPRYVAEPTALITKRTRAV